LPTVVVFAPEGDEIGRVDGYVPASDFLSTVEPMLASGREG
jgi:thioredoxin-related protein